MSSDEWDAIVTDVTESMVAYIQPFVTPLSSANKQNVWLVGSGTYFIFGSQRNLLTCEHVAHEAPIHYHFNGWEDVFEVSGHFTMEKHPVDAALVSMEDELWRSCQHKAAAVSYERFAAEHRVAMPAELLFFLGWSGENAHYGFGVHQTNATGYCSQEVLNSGDGQNFEMFWDPQQTRFTTGTSDAAKGAVRCDDPHGFSGSLVWNTRYLEITNQGGSWVPSDAVVTGLLRRWDQKKKTLLVWRIEHLRTWIEKQVECRS